MSEMNGCYLHCFSKKNKNKNKISSLKLLYPHKLINYNLSTIHLHAEIKYQTNGVMLK